MMTNTETPVRPLPGTQPNRMFPQLTPNQMARIAVHGRLRRVERGEVLVEPGEESSRFFVVRTGQIDIVQVFPGAEGVVAICRGSQFTGEVNLLSGRPTLMRLRVSEPGELIELDRVRLLGLVQGDSELSEILMRSFILRRVELIARGIGNVVLVGSSRGRFPCHLLWSIAS